MKGGICRDTQRERDKSNENENPKDSTASTYERTEQEDSRAGGGVGRGGWRDEEAKRGRS